ncbi:terminase large subunit domain-containing protein [Microbacterium sp. AR7-10]|uniref:terminase large subunit domain-containing protein n=1 Tax=Microbacterium sp. AR7-10 TaxID=1891970 RepID=UPI000B18599B|nr:terminase large subunit [Microbacterium sp. AR7-10]
MKPSAAEIQPWPPARWTPPLSPDFASAIDGYLPLFHLVWERAFGYTLEAWQITTIRHALEIYPEGHPRAGQLRHRQVIISLGRQNGKTEIAAAIGLWALLMKARPTVVGIASNADQAKLVYKRTMGAIKGTPQLARKFRALTETRGIQTIDGGTYEIKAAKSAALQGIPVDVGLVDELHILVRELWFDLINGLGGRPNSLVVGITTAGDAGSELLLYLYDLGEQAIAAGIDGDRRVGFYCWEALEAHIPPDGAAGDAELAREIARANPSVASGRRDMEIELAEVRGMPPQDAIRYRLNRFVDSVSEFITRDLWDANYTREPFPDGRPLFTIDRTPGWDYASIGVFGKMPDGRTYCDLAASIVRPTISQLADICQQLARHNPTTFGMDGLTLKDLGKELELRGLPVTMITHADILNGSALFYSKVQQGQLAHPGNDLLARQIPVTKRKDSGDGFKISRKESSVAIDGVMSHVIGVQLAETQLTPELQMF